MRGDSEEPNRPGRDQMNLGVMFGYRHADLNRFNRPVRTRMPGGVAGERILVSAPYADSALLLSGSQSHTFAPF